MRDFLTETWLWCGTSKQLRAVLGKLEFVFGIRL